MKSNNKKHEEISNRLVCNPIDFARFVSVNKYIYVVNTKVWIEFIFNQLIFFIMFSCDFFLFAGNSLFFF